MTTEGQGSLVNVLDIHLPLFSGTKQASGGIAAAKPYVYGTAFPIAKGIFATAGHVLLSAKADGAPCLGTYSGKGGQIAAHEITESEAFPSIDFAIMRCPSLESLPPLPIGFLELGMWDPALALGFPFAADAEWVSIIPRAFRGHIVTRRRLSHVEAHPPGYEVSFPSPKGLSGSPLISGRGQKLACFGHIIQQSILGAGEDTLQVGLAIDANAWLWLESQLLGKPVAHLFGKEKVDPPPVGTAPLPGGLNPKADLDQGWPEV